MRFSTASIVAILAYTAAAQVGDAIDSAVKNGGTELGNVVGIATSAIGNAVTGDAGAIYTSITQQVGGAISTGKTKAHPIRHS